MLLMVLMIRYLYSGSLVYDVDEKIKGTLFWMIMVSIQLELRVLENYVLGGAVWPLPLLLPRPLPRPRPSNSHGLSLTDWVLRSP